MESFRPFILAGAPLDWAEAPAAGAMRSREIPGGDATRIYELHSAGSVLAYLRWRADANCSALVLAGETRWALERTRLLRRRVRVEMEHKGTELTSFPYACDGVTEVDLPGGRHVKYLRTASFAATTRVPGASGMSAGSDWVWLNEDRREVLRLAESGHVTLGSPALSDPDAPLLVVLGWYLILLCAHEQA